MSGDGSSPERDDINRLNEKVTILSERLHHLYHEIRQVFNILDDIKSTPILSPTAGTDSLRLKIKYINFNIFLKSEKRRKRRPRRMISPNRLKFSRPATFKFTMKIARNNKSKKNLKNLFFFENFFAGC